MSQRREFVALAERQALPFAALCRRFGISRKTGYKLRTRYRAAGEAGLADASRRPHHSPTRTDATTEERILAVRDAHPAWGGRKIAAIAAREGWPRVPAPSTVTHVLHRHGRIGPPVPGTGGRWQRFEHPFPNTLWQMDFMGDFPTATQRCHALTMLDDHSRYNLMLEACAGTRRAPVQAALERTLRRYGLPACINTDHGQPWGSPSAGAAGSLSQLAIWLIRLGIRVSHSRPAHPQTNGKDERFHLTVQRELTDPRTFPDLPAVQRAFDAWRLVYNHQRPHEALGMAVPAERYQPSTIAFPEILAPITYPDSDTVVAVGWNGELRFAGRRLRVSRALQGLPVGLRPDPTTDGRFDLYFCAQRFGRIDLRAADETD